MLGTLLLCGVLASGMNTQDKLVLTPRDNCQIIISGADGIGEMRLWVPEGIVSNTGASSVYPKGGSWKVEGAKLSHEVTEKQLIGGGNCPLVDERTFECCGFRFPLDSPVKWKTTVEAKGQTVRFGIKLTNTGDRTIRKAGAAVCLKFEKADWWSDHHVFVLSGGKVRSLAELGRGAGVDDIFEAYLLKGESLDHAFYRGFWGFNEHRLDKPVMVSENPKAGVRVTISAGKAYFLHSNKHNPCTDVMLAFGDIAPGKTSEAEGHITISHRIP